MSSELVEIAGQSVVNLTAKDIRAQVNLIQEVMKEVMQDGQHYGKIPGCGDKPTLLKPGAEKLSMVFRLRSIIDNDRDIRIEHLENGHKNIHVYCHVFNMVGVELATGVGSCSTLESKYRYRGGEKISTGQVVPKEYWNFKKEGKMAEAIASIGGSGHGVAKIDGQWEVCEIGEKMENPDIADVYNTVLKMAKKRAYVDGILSATAASDLFTQDIEDMNPSDIGKAAVVKSPPSAEGKPSVAMPQSKPVVVDYVDLITFSQGKIGDKMNVSAYIQEIKPSTTKAPSAYVVADLPKDPTVTLTIKAFGDVVNVPIGGPIKFNDVLISEFKGKQQATAREVING